MAQTPGGDTIAIVAAGGSGSRLGASRPKQFLELAGKPLLVHTVARFVDSPEVDRIVLVLPREDFEEHVQLMKRWFPPDLQMVPGGETRQDSVWSGVSTIPPEFEGYVLVHDGARPLVSQLVIRDVVAAARRFGGAIAGLPVSETLKEVSSPDGSDASDSPIVVATVDRRRYYHAQTPQCFHHRILRTALERARSSGFQGTDEAQLVERLGESVRVVPGSVRNIKITTRDHLTLAEHYLASADEGSGR